MSVRRDNKTTSFRIDSCINGKQYPTEKFELQRPMSVKEIEGLFESIKNDIKTRLISLGAVKVG